MAYVLAMAEAVFYLIIYIVISFAILGHIGTPNI